MRADFDGLRLAVVGTPGSAAEAACSASSDDLEIARSDSGLSIMIGAGFLLTFLSSTVAFGWWGAVGASETATGYVGVLLFCLATCRLIWMLPTARGPVVIISPYGVRDLRIGNEFLLWDSITEVTSDERHGSKVVVLKLTPALQHQFGCTRTRRQARLGIRETSVDHIVVSPEGLATSFDALLRTCRAFHAASEQHAALQHSVR